MNLFSRVSGSKINYEKSKGLYLGKWKTRSDHPFGISWVKCHKILGYWFGEDMDPDESWSKCFSKFDKTLKLWLTRRLSLKGKSTVLNSLGISKVLYYATASELPSHYEILFQRSAFRFVWNSTYEPVSRDTLYLDFAKGGLNIPNFKLKCEALLLSYCKNWFLIIMLTGLILRDIGLVCNSGNLIKHLQVIQFHIVKPSLSSINHV